MIGAVAQFVGGVWVGGIQAYAEMYRAPEPPEEWPAAQEWLELPRRTAGDVIPVVFGTVWLDEPHVFWVTDVRSGVLSITSGAGDLVVGYNMFEPRRRFVGGMGLVLCQGPLDSIARIDVADRVLVGSLDPVGTAPVLDLSAGTDEIEVWQPHLHGASTALQDAYDDGVAGRLGVAPGLEAQSGLVIPRWGTSRGNLVGVSTAWMRGPGANFDWSTYTEWPSPQILTRRDGSAYDDPYAFYFGARPELRPWRYLVTRCLGRNGGITQWYDTAAEVRVASDLAGSEVYDLNPAHVLVELLCDPFWGLDLGDPEDVIDETSFEAMADQFALAGVGIGISWVWDRESQYLDIVRQIERICDVVLEHEASDDRWHLRWWRSSVTPVEIGDDDIVDIDISVTSADELPTTIHVTWTDRRRGREQTYVLQDLAALHVRGREIVHWLDARMIASPVTVPQIARRELARLVVPRVMVDVVVLRDVAVDLRRTDIVTLTSTEHGLSGDFRVLEWDHGVRTDGTVRLTLVGEPAVDETEPIWHEPGDPVEVTPEALPELTSLVDEMPLHVWWSMEPNAPDLPERLWAIQSPDQITRLWMWATRPTDRWDLDGWRWADRLLDDTGTPEGYITVSPELSAFSASFSVTTLNRSNDRIGTDTLEHDGTRVLRVGDILAIPHIGSPITSLDSSGLSLADRGNLASRKLDYAQMDGAYEFVVVTAVDDSTHVTVLGGLWDTLPAASIGGTSYVVGFYPVTSPWDCAPDELRVSGAGQVRRAPPTIDTPLAVRDAVQTAALAVSGSRVKAFDDVTPDEVPLSGGDVPAALGNQTALVRPIRPLAGAYFEIFEIDDGGDSRISITAQPRTRDSRLWAPSTLSTTSMTVATATECAQWPDDPPKLILWVIDLMSGDVIATRPWTEAYSAGELALLNSDERALHNAIYGSHDLFEALTLIVTADASLSTTPPEPLKSLHSWQYIRFDLVREEYVYTFSIDGTADLAPEAEATQADLVLYVAPSPYYPFVRDYIGLLDDDDFTDGLTLPTPRNQRPLFPADSRNRPEFDNLSSDSSLEITGALTLRCGIHIASTPTASNSLIAYGSGGGSGATNSLYRLLATEQGGTARCSFFSENGAGVDNEAEWELPFGPWIVGRSYIVEARRSSGGTVKMYINGQQLAWVRSTTNVTDNGDGSVDDFDADQGTDSQLTLGDDTDPDEIAPYFWAVYDDEKTDGDTWAAGRIGDTLAMYQPDASLHTTLNAEADTILCISSADGSLADLAGNVEGGDWTTTPTEQELIVGSSWTVAHGECSNGSTPALLIHDDLVVRVKLRLMDTTLTSNETIITTGNFGTDTNPVNNTSWQMYFNSSTQVTWFQEYSNGSNATATFDLADTIKYGQIIYLNARRTDNGDSTVDIEMWCQQDYGTFQKMNLAATSGTDNGDDTATITQSTGGSSGAFGLGTFPGNASQDLACMFDVAHVKNTTTDDSTENAAAALLMPDE